MEREAYFKNKEFIDAASQIIATDGLNALTIAALAKRIKAPVGSVYTLIYVEKENGPEALQTSL